MLAEFLCYLTTPEAWKKLEQVMNTKWNILYAVYTDQAIKKPPLAGSEYFCPIVFVTALDGDYKFIWDVCTGSSGTCSNAQILTNQN